MKLNNSKALILDLNSYLSVLCMKKTRLSENDDRKCLLLHCYSQYLTTCRASMGDSSKQRYYQNRKY